MCLVELYSGILLEFGLCHIGHQELLNILNMICCMFFFYDDDVGVTLVPHVGESSPVGRKRRQEPTAASKAQGKQCPVLTWQTRFLACQSLRL